MKTVLIFLLLAWQLRAGPLDYVLPLAQLEGIGAIDDREDILSTDYPWSAIGKVVTQVNCAGILVGRNIVATALHCVDGRGDSIRFCPNYMRGTCRTWAKVIDTPMKGAQWDTADGGWIFLKLDQNLGDTYGTFDIDDSSLKELKDMGAVFNLAGYPGNRNNGATGSVHRGCSVLNESNGIIEHSCDATPGNSGGPLFYMAGRKAKLVGIHARAYEDPQGGFASWARNVKTTHELVQKGFSATRGPSPENLQIISDKLLEMQKELDSIRRDLRR